MKFKYKTKISLTTAILNLVILTGFFYLVFNANKFESCSKPILVQAYSDNLNILKEEISDGSTINVN